MLEAALRTEHRHAFGDAKYFAVVLLAKAAQRATCRLVGRTYGSELRFSVDDLDLPLSQVCRSTAGIAKHFGDWYPASVANGWRVAE